MAGCGVSLSFWELGIVMGGEWWMGMVLRGGVGVGGMVVVGGLRVGGSCEVETALEMRGFHGQDSWMV